MTAALADGPKMARAADSQLLGVVHAAFGDFAKALASRVGAVIVELEQKGGSAKALAKSVQQRVPQVFEQQFQAQFLVDEEGARRQRALLAYLLSTVELQSATGQSRKGNRDAMLDRPSIPEAADAEEMTSEQAAKLLHVSRTHVNTLVASGALGTARLTPGGHRRLSKDAVLRYKEQSKSRQAKGLADMVEASERLGLYDAELAGIPVRRKK